MGGLVADHRPVSWARRRALDAVMAWIRDRERHSPPILGPEREYVDGNGITTISGAGKVYASEAVDRMEKLLVDLAVPDLAREHGEMLALLREFVRYEYQATTEADYLDTPEGETSWVHTAAPKARGLIERIEERTKGGV
jgi:hypothetical protein